VKYLVFLFWIPAILVLYLSIHQEVQAERDRNAHRLPRTEVPAGRTRS